MACERSRLREVLVFDPQTLGDLAHRRPRQQLSARLVGERVLDVAGRGAPRVKFDRQALELLRPPAKRCGAEYSTAAVFTLPVR